MEISTKIVRQEPIVLVHGPGGAGKTTFCSSDDASLTVPIEDGAGSLVFARVAQPTSWPETYNALVEIAEAGKELDAYRQIVIDAIDKVEPLIWDFVCEQQGKASIEAFGYGKGYVIADTEWRKLLAVTSAIRDTGRAVLIIAHSGLQTVDDPRVGSYSRWGPQLHKRAQALLVEHADIVGHLAPERVPVDKGGDHRTTRTSRAGGKRRLLLDDDGSAVAKNRYARPQQITVPAQGGYAKLRELIEKSFGPANEEH